MEGWCSVLSILRGREEVPRGVEAQGLSPQRMERIQTSFWLSLLMIPAPRLKANSPATDEQPFKTGHT